MKLLEEHPVRRSLRFFSFLVALLLLSSMTALAADDVLTPHSIARIRSVTSVAISPDGQHVAYGLSVPRDPLVDDNGPAWTELHVAGPDGTSRPYITGHVSVSQIAWTPDGHAISFLARRGLDKSTSLYVIPLDGGEAWKVLENETSIRQYSWSADGKRVAFRATDATSKARRELSQKGFNQEIYEEDEQFTRVWVAEIGGKKKLLDLPGSAVDVDWSPVGSRLMVVLAPTPLIDDAYMRSKVHVVDADSGKVLTKIENPGKLGTVAWSPDGQYLAMISAEDINDPEQGRLMVVPAAGGALHNLLPDYQGHAAAIAWMDNDTVMFVGDEGVWTTLGSVDRDGANRKTMVATGGAILTALSLSRDGQSAAFIGQTPEHPTELFRMKHGDATPHRVTDSNPWLAGIRMAKQEVVKYKARDGLEIEGILIRPLDEKSGTRYPLILTVHGGPESHYRNGWMTSYSSPGQMAAARGFAVFFPNYRGSTGRGVEFSKLDRGDPAGKEFDDLVDGVDHLVALGLVDRDKVGVTGGSYGGYATAWCSTYYTDRFAAGVMFVGISDEISKIGTTDIPWEMYYVHFGFWPWDNWEHTLERSPIYHAGKSKTPLLILGGLDDPRVNPGQSMEMYRHLKLRSKVPVRLVRYPGEQHGNRRAAARLDYSLRQIQWLEHYLKGPGGDPPPMEIDYTAPK